MDPGDDHIGRWLPLSEAASALGLTIDGMRSRIRRRQIDTRKDNRGHLLVNVPETALEASQDAVKDKPDTDILAELDELREKLAEERVARARAEAERGAARELVAELKKMLEHERRSWVAKLLDAWRKPSG